MQMFSSHETTVIITESDTLLNSDGVFKENLLGDEQEMVYQSLCRKYCRKKLSEGHQRGLES